MADYNPGTMTATVAAASNTVTIAGADISAIKQGMNLYFGSRTKKGGTGYKINAVAATGTSGGILTLYDNVASGDANGGAAQPCIIDMLSYTGDLSALALQTNVANALALNDFLGVGTSVAPNSKKVRRNKGSSAASNVDEWAINGLLFSKWEQYATGGAERFALRYSPDGTLLSDVFYTQAGGVDFLAISTDVASAATSLKVQVTGTTAITSLGSGLHKVRLVRFASTLTLTHNATSLICPGAANITTAAGDTCWLTSDGSGNWRVQTYTRADGRALIPTTSYASQLTVTNSGSGVRKVGLALVNPNDAVDTSAVIDLTPNTSGSGVRSCQLVATNSNGATAVDFFVAISYGDVAAERTRWTYSAQLPGGDNVYNLGSASKRYANTYFAVASTVGSDRRLKTNERALSAAERRVAARIARLPGLYQMRDSVALKGAGGARLHVGLIAQEVAAAFEAEGLDARRYAMFCEDALTAPVEKSRTVRRAVVDRVEERAIEVVDGVPTVVARTVEVPRISAVQVIGEDGAPVPGLTHPVPVTEDVEETYTVEEATGETRLGLRYEQLLVFMMAAVPAAEAA